MTTLADTARTTVETHDMLPEGSVVVAMVSGGADSSALLHLLAGGLLGGGVSLSVLHVDHLLRGAESDADAQFVADECSRLGVPCRTVRVDVAAYAAEDGLNLEDAGRTVRYRLAEQEADARARAAGVPASAARIAVAHTLDDRIETLCMRLLTGAGAGGLASIRHVRGRIIRPLLDCERRLVRPWLEARDLRWREDVSNTDVSRFRARVRHELLPVLEHIEPSFRTTLARSMAILAEEDELLSGMAAAFARDFSAEGGAAGEVALDRAKVRTLTRAMKRRVVREALAGTFPDATRIDSAHIESVVDGLDDDAFARDLPHDLRAFSEYGRMVIVRREEKPAAMAPALLSIPGIARLGRFGTVTAIESQPDAADLGPCEVVVDVGNAAELTVTGLLPGDRMRPLGMAGSKKLSDVCIDAKVPGRERHGLPVVRDGERIVWLAGVRLSDEYKVDENTERAVRLTWNAVDTSGAAEETSDQGEMDASGS